MGCLFTISDLRDFTIYELRVVFMVFVLCFKLWCVMFVNIVGAQLMPSLGPHGSSWVPPGAIWRHSWTISGQPGASFGYLLERLGKPTTEAS